MITNFDSDNNYFFISKFYVISFFKKIQQKQQVRMSLFLPLSLSNDFFPIIPLLVDVLKWHNHFFLDFYYIFPKKNPKQSKI